MASAPTVPAAVEPSNRAIAPAWHTVLLILVLIGFSVLGARSGQRMMRHGRVVPYIFTTAFEWVVVAFIAWGVKRRGLRLADILGEFSPRPKDVLRDVGIAAGFLVVAQVVLGVIGHLLKSEPNQAIRSLLPQTALEMAAWVVLSFTAGVCEEIMFRGYFLRQFSAWTGSVAAGIILQGIFFGLDHGYQGWKLMTVIAVYGTMFGLLARWRRSVRPGMFAHFAQDAAGGLLARYLH
jgi:membrane protease YdiL (CAAX protease family)